MSTIYKMLLLLIALFPIAEARGQQLRLALDSASALQGSHVEIALRARNFADILSAQASIGFDPQIVQFDTVTVYGLPGLVPASFSTSMVANGKLSFSWDDTSLQGVSLPDDSAIFKLRFSLIGAPGSSSPLNFAATPVPTEFSDTSFSPVPLDTLPGLIEIEDTSTVGLISPIGFTAYTIKVLPNPVNENSVVRVELQQAEALRFELWGVDGKRIDQRKMVMAAGETEITFSNLFPARPEGLYLLLCEGVAGRSLIKLMIRR